VSAQRAYDPIRGCSIRPPEDVSRQPVE
jgi:hypothetical protein